MQTKVPTTSEQAVPGPLQVGIEELYQPYKNLQVRPKKKKKRIRMAPLCSHLDHVSIYH